MIDETVLERWLSDVASEVPVPAEGSLRILEARDAALPRRRPRLAVPRFDWVRNHRGAAAWLGVAATVGLLVLGAAALGGGSGTTSSSADKAAAPAGTAYSHSPRALPAPTGAARSSATPAGAAPSAAMSSGAASGATGGESQALSKPGASSSGASGVPSLPTKVEKTGSLRLQVGAGQIQSTVNQLTSQATGLGGFVASSSVESAPGSTATGDVTVQVPVGDFQSYLAFAQKLGTTLSVTTSGQNVTSNYVDLQARIQALDDARAQYEQILSRASSIGDILSVESQISDLQTQIEQLQGQLDVLNNQTAYSTLDVQVTQKAPAVVVPPPAPKLSGLSKAWAHARHSFAHGLEAVVGSLGGIAVFLVVVGFLVAGGRFGWVLLRRRIL